MSMQQFVRCLVLLLALISLASTTAGVAVAQDPEARRWEEISSAGVDALLHQRSVWLKLDSSVVAAGKAEIPRICAPIRSIRWLEHPDAAIKFVPEPEHWVFSWKKAPSESPVIEVIFDTDPVLPADCPMAVPAGDGSVMLSAYQASTFGEKLRFEPQWYKNTVGYWAVADDYATWKLTIDKPGTYSVAVLQGCGKGQGGSEAIMTLSAGEKIVDELPFQTIDTGHFQNFRWNHLGFLEVTEGGDYELKIIPKRIAKVALFDVRTIHLVPQAKP